MNPSDIGIGDIVWWSIPDEINCRRSDWNKTYPDLPLPSESAGDPLRRALYSIKAPKGTRRLIRPLKTNGDWAIVIETPDIGDLNYVVDMIVKIDRGSLYFIKTTSYSDWAFELGKAYEHEVEAIQSAALADAVLLEIRGHCLAVQARKTGGVYFVPAMYRDRIDKIADVLKDIGGQLFTYHVGMDEHSRDQVLSHVVDDMKSTVDVVKNRIENRHKTEAVTEAKQALDRIRYYKDAFELLTGESSKIEKQINDLIVEALTKKEKTELANVK